LRTDARAEPLRFNRAMLAITGAIRIADVRVIQERYQFVLRTLFFWTLALAVLMSLWNVFCTLVAKPVWTSCLIPECALFVAVPLVCVWIVLAGLVEGEHNLLASFLFAATACLTLIAFRRIVLPAGFYVPGLKQLTVAALLCTWLVIARLVGFCLYREGWLREE